MKKKTIYIVSAILAVLVLAGGGFLMYYSSPEASLARFQKALEEKNYETATKYIDEIKVIDNTINKAVESNQEIEITEENKTEFRTFFEDYIKQSVENSQLVSGEMEIIERDSNRIKVSFKPLPESEEKQSAFFERAGLDWVMVEIEI